MAVLSALRMRLRCGRLAKRIGVGSPLARINSSAADTPPPRPLSRVRRAEPVAMPRAIWSKREPSMRRPPERGRGKDGGQHARCASHHKAQAGCASPVIRRTGDPKDRAPVKPCLRWLQYSPKVLPVKRVDCQAAAIGSTTASRTLHVGTTSDNSILNEHNDGVCHVEYSFPTSIVSRFS
jgi:hypothetical protein